MLCTAPMPLASLSSSPILESELSPFERGNRHRWQVDTTHDVMPQTSVRVTCGNEQICQIMLRINWTSRKCTASSPSSYRQAESHWRSVIRGDMKESAPGKALAGAKVGTTETGPTIGAGKALTLASNQIKF